ncbi:MAG: transglycosylase SLT domain-containing protein [Cyanobacteria bacterium P01_F01_bin.3]
MVAINSIWAVALLTFLGFVQTANASNDTKHISEICNAAARHAANESRVPIDVLLAISLTETGRRIGTTITPWPWTVNMEGVGKWFDDQKSAKLYVREHFRRGARSFDVGCFQINYKWHGHAFSSINEMFDPIENARYAARFLNELYDEFGNWSKAAGAYHSRTAKHANRYRARFNRIRKNLSIDSLYVSNGTVAERTSTVAPDKTSRNDYPFLIASEIQFGPSLIPQTNGRLSILSIEERRPFLEVR